jgi:hypothetical protein
MGALTLRAKISSFPFVKNFRLKNEELGVLLPAVAGEARFLA